MTEPITTPMIRETLRAEIARIGQSEASRRSGVPQPSISAWLRGTRPMNHAHLARLAAACGYRLEVRLVRAHAESSSRA